MPIRYKPEDESWELYDTTKEEWEKLMEIGKNAFMSHFSASIFRQMMDKVTPEEMEEAEALMFMKNADPDSLPQA